MIRTFAGSLARAWRGFKRRPSFFAIAVSSLAVALGLATTVIAQIDSLMHPYSPIRDVERVFAVYERGFGTGGRMPTHDEVLAGLRSTGLYEAIAPAEFMPGQIEVGQGVIQVDISLAGSEYFAALGVTPRLGRLFAPSETLESGVAIVGDQFWQQYLGNPATIGDATFTYENKVYRIVGVLGREWERAVSYGARWREESLIWLAPYATRPTGRGAFPSFTGRLKRGVTEKNANAVHETLAARWRAAYGTGRPPFRVGMQSVKPNPLQLGEFHYAMIGAAIFILVIASANVSALMLARSVATRRDQALRLAVGARRRDLFIDVAAEVSLLALTGAVLGIVIAFVVMGLMTAATPAELTWLGFERPNWNPRVFFALFGAVFVSIAMSTMVPAWYVTRIAPAEPLKDSAGTTSSRSKSRFKLLVIGELALAMVLLLGASLIWRTAHNVATFDFGYEARQITRIGTGVAVVQRLSPPLPPESARFIGRRTPEIVAPELDAVIERMRALPDIRDAAWFARDGAERNIVVSQSTIAIDSMLPNPTVFNVGPGFMRTLGIRIVDGRDFVEGDRTTVGSAIIDERSAARLFPEGTPVGKLIKLGHAQSREPWVRVVGVARNAVHELPEYPEMDRDPVIYVSRQKSRGFFPIMVFRSARNTSDVSPHAIRVVRDAVPPRVFLSSSPWLPNYDKLLAGRRFTAAIFAALSLASLVLATAGLFGVLSYAVNQRMREFSLRIALGAQQRDILGLVAHDGLVMVLGGTAIGAFVGMYAAFSVYYWLWGVYPVDAVSLIIAEAVLLIVTAAASAIPAFRAMRANPAEVMRAI